MRPISLLCVVVRLLLLLSVLLASSLICYYGVLIHRPSPSLHNTPTVAITDKVPRLNPASLINSAEVPHIDDQLRLLAYHRLTARLARYATSRPVAATSINSQLSTEKRQPLTLSTQTVHHGVMHANPSSDEQQMLRSIGGHSNQSDTVNLHINNSMMSVALNPMNKPSLPLTHTLHWPQPRAIRSTRELMSEQWIADLQSCITRMTSHEITLLTSNQQYTEVLLNWLIAAVARASVDLSQVLVIALDERLYSLLKEKGIVSVLVRPASLLTTNALREGVFPAVMMTRLAIIRLLNHWGYDVVNYDTDAILLRDMSPLLHSGDDIVGTFGRFPTDLTKQWGITLCTALLVVRSSRTTEEFWEAVSRSAPSSYSDQGKINYGLQVLDMQWNLPSLRLATLSKIVQGHCRNGLRVSLLPYSVACRAGSCTHKALSSGLYIWHKGGARAGNMKREGAEEGGVWFLRSDWTVGCNMKTDKEWLKCISTV